MGTTLLLSEFLVTGLIALLSTFFTFLTFFNIYDITTWFQSNNLAGSTPLIVFVSLPLSYTLGASLYRLLSPDTWSIFLKLFSKEYETNREEDRKLIFLYQNGSDNLVKRIEYIQNLNRLFRNSLITTALFVVSFTCWITKGWVANWKAGVLSGIICFIVFCLSAINWLGTRRELSYTVDKATFMLTEAMDLNKP